MKPSFINQNVQRSAAIIAGVSLLIMAVAAFISYGYAHLSLVVIGDPASTLRNIQESFSLFQLEIVGWVVIILLDIVMSWAFYVYLKPVHAEYSLLAAWLRLIYTAILVSAVSHLIIASRIIQENSNEMLASQIMTSIIAFESIWSIGLIVFGTHLIMIGYVAMKATHIPKLISIFIIVAGVSYMLIHVLYGFLPQFEQVTTILETILSIPMMMGEVGFGLWLLLKGRKVNPYMK